jgi:hypothetical protein
MTRARKSAITLGLALAVAAAGPVGAVDHNNLDSGRPLKVEDAESIAFGEQALEVGLGLGLPRRRPLGLGLHAEYLNGLALNTHLSVGFEPRVGGRAGESDTRADFGDVSLGVFHNFNRETEKRPALAARADVVFPTGRHARGVGVRLRGIVSRHADQYGRLHLNADLFANPGAARGERQFVPGLTLGYSRPLGYPRHFDSTVVVEASVAGASARGAGPTATLGIGYRRQVTPRSVLDVGLQSDVAGGGPRDRLRLIFGYSTAF